MYDSRKKGIRRDDFYTNNNEEMLIKLLKANVKRGPSGDYNEIKPNWKNAIEAIYIVRCNLFHGDKGDAPADPHIVYSAYRTLLDLIGYCNPYLWNNFDHT